MTAPQEIAAIAASLEVFCRVNDWKLVGLHTEEDVFQGQRLAACPRLYLTHVAEELVSGHLIPLITGQSFFLLSRATLAASATLKIVTLRTYSLILVHARGLAINRCEREVLTPPPRPEPRQLLAAATDAVVQAITPEQAFIQPVTSAPFPTKDTQILAYRSVFCTGTIAGTVLPAAQSGKDEAPAAAPAQFYLL
jgi:hypothetical protein